MPDYLVEVPKGGWESWKDSVRRSRVRFDSRHFRLGEELLANSELPSQNRILQVHDCAHPTSVTYLSKVIQTINPQVPVHPLYLLALAQGIEGSPDEPIFHHMQYSMAMSPFQLKDGKGTTYIFYLHNDGRHFSGRFEMLVEDGFLPRCTHILGYRPHEEPDHKDLRGVFTLREGGKYGRFVQQ